MFKIFEEENLSPSSFVPILSGSGVLGLPIIH